MEHFVEQVAKDHAACKQPGNVGAQLAEQPPGGEGDGQAVQHDQPGWKQDDAPVPGAVVSHVIRGEEAVVVASVACVEQPGEGMFVMAQVAVHEIDTQVEKQQAQGHGQPLEGGDIGGGGPGQRDAGDAVAKHECGVQPGVVTRVDACAVTVAESLGRVGHGRLLAVFLFEAELSWRKRMCEFLLTTSSPCGSWLACDGGVSGPDQ